MTNERRTIQAAGEERWYLLSVPGAHDGRRPLPLVVDFHGLAEGAQLHGAATRFSELGAQEGFVVATPNGRFEPVRWDANPNSPTNADLAYVTTLLDTLGRDLCLDTSRVYATGLSMGAMMSSLLACRMADRFAAVAPVAGINDVEPCPASRAMPVLTFHGTADPILPFNGGVGDIVGKLLTGKSGGGPATTLPPVDLNGPGYPANVAGWAARNGCEATPTDTKVSGTLIHRVYRCPAGAEVEFYIVEGGGHTWPGSPVYKAMAGIMGPTSDEIDATAEAWRFFQRHRLP